MYIYIFEYVYMLVFVYCYMLIFAFRVGIKELVSLQLLRS